MTTVEGNDKRPAVTNAEEREDAGWRHGWTVHPDGRGPGGFPPATLYPELIDDPDYLRGDAQGREARADADRGDTADARNEFGKKFG